jgi:exodeoxyribonuclease-5
MRELFGFTQPLPEAGDKLVCLRNDRTKGLLNGSLWKVKTTAAMRRNKLRMSLVPEDDLARKAVRVGVIPAFFESEEEIPFALRKDSDEFDYGYALTVHKSQGSQWDEVVLFDESYAFREHRNRWLYTGITRAAERLTIVR